MTTTPVSTPTGTPVDESAIRDILSGVIDPEIGMNIVALGLVYRVDISPDQVLVEMTMTSPACPMGDMIHDEVVTALTETLPEHLTVDVRLVWEPPWNPAMMTQAAKDHFGWTPD
ncbi:metal-sulfur cluster assembly factor [Azospira inquinata]|uniref:Metal-sulfur cluster assembly factor n=1 Tax=Azospira inquinata TaxID=2785627 RepID=A0A975SN89_9RHOO|nr:metal-sulfur cluster assembly factor [Azospira inquinata]QWT45231.1 metal-sulfur cluster assembly factor [Azospira inquinata]QWT49437.1 metal-sulfur cluster assembly factor [Azospira inquinata]